MDTEGRGVDAISTQGPVVNGVEYPVDLLIYASGFEVTTDLHKRLGFDPKGVGGTRCSERWAQGAHTLHGVMASGFPNLLLISLVQGARNKLLPSPVRSGQTRGPCRRGLRKSGESTRLSPRRRQRRSGFPYFTASASVMLATFASCTPSFYNSEQQTIDTRAARNLTYSGSLLDYVGFLEGSRGSGIPGRQDPDCRVARTALSRFT